MDLLRGGTRLPLDDMPDCEYYALVSRREERPRIGIWPIRLRELLPGIPIPLRSPDPDARLDLKQALDRVYDAAGYANDLDTTPLQPPLSSQDTPWAEEFLPQAPTED